MKKILYSLAMLSMLFTSCEPLEEVYTELDAQEDVISGTSDYTLIDSDYEMVLEDEDATAFDSSEQAGKLVPDVLNVVFPVYGEGSTVNVTYNLLDPLNGEDYTVSQEDYAQVGLTSLNTEADFNALLSFKFPNTVRGTFVNLTYNTLAPTIDYTLTDEDYDFVGNGRFNNFDIRPGRAEESIEVRREKIEQILLENFPQVTGQQYLVTYAIFDGSVGTRDMLVKLNAAGNYELINSYTLTNADYALVGNGRFNNFDIRSGRDEETVEARRAKIETILLNNFPATVAGEQYFVTYAIYDGAPGTRNMLLEFNGAGYDIVGATLIEKESTLVYNEGWDLPVTFTDEDYTAMGQSFPNFSNEEIALYRIGIYLKMLYPFAEADDFLAVEYQFFSNGVSNKNVNYMFDGTSWVVIPVVTETVQFGKKDGVWEPDNTIKYTLTDADYALVGNGRFNNFDIRVGRDEETIEVRLEKINTILLNNFPTLGEGQKFVVTYKVFDGSRRELTISLINEGGEYVINND